MMITPPARLDTSTPVSTSTIHIRRKKTMTGNRITKSTMDKMFKLQPAVSANKGNLIKTQFPGKHRSGKTHFFQHMNAGQIMNNHLS